MTDQAQESPALLSAEGVGRMLSISRRQVFRLDASQKLPGHVRVGQRRRWLRDELLAWADCGCPGLEEWEAMKKATGGLAKTAIRDTGVLLHGTAVSPLEDL